MNNKLRAVAKRVCVCVSRLHIDTTSEEVQSYLTETGITEVQVKKLSDTSKDGRRFKTSAFQIFVDARHEEAMYDSASWPSGCVIL